MVERNSAGEDPEIFSGPLLKTAGLVGLPPEENADNGVRLPQTDQVSEAPQDGPPIFQSDGSSQPAPMECRQSDGECPVVAGCEWPPEKLNQWRYRHRPELPYSHPGNESGFPVDTAFAAGEFPVVDGLFPLN